MPKVNFKVVDALIDGLAKKEKKAKDLADEIKAEREELKGLMLDGKLDERTTDAGASAKLIEQTNLTWDADKLLKVLPPHSHDTLLPRKPDGAKLRALSEAGTLDLSKCREAETTHRLIIKAA